MRRTIAITLLSALVPIGAGRALEPKAVLGQLAGSGASVDGSAVPSGTSLVSGVTLSTSSEPVSIHFQGGTMVRLANDSRGRFEQVGPSVVQVAVLAGALAFQDEGGDVQTVREGAKVQLDVDQRDDRRDEVKVCHLVDPEPDDAARVAICRDHPQQAECEWRRIRVELDLLGDHMTANPADIPVDKELRELHRRPDLELPGDCRRGILIPPVWLLGGGGTLATGAVIDEVVRRDSEVDEPVVSPIRN